MDKAPDYSPRHAYEQPTEQPNDRLSKVRRFMAVLASAMVAVVPSSTAEFHAQTVPLESLTALADSSDEFVDSDRLSVDLDMGNFKISDRDMSVSSHETKESLRITTWNSLYSNLKDVGVEAENIMQDNGSSILVMQEVHGKKQRINVEDALCGVFNEYGCYIAPYKHKKEKDQGGSSESSYPIVWDRDQVDLIGKGQYRRMTDGYINSLGDKISARYATWAKFRDKHSVGHEEFYAVNTHLPSGVEKNGEPQLGTEAIERYEEHMKNLSILVAELLATGNRVIVAGDFNVSYEGDDGTVSIFPKQWAKQNGLVHSPGALSKTDGDVDGPISTFVRDGGTPVKIDYVFVSAAGGGPALLSDKVDPNTRASDHNPYSLGVEPVSAIDLDNISYVNGPAKVTIDQPQPQPVNTLPPATYLAAPHTSSGERLRKYWRKRKKQPGTRGPHERHSSSRLSRRSSLPH